MKSFCTHLPFLAALLVAVPLVAGQPEAQGRAEAALSRVMEKRGALGLDQRHTFKVRNVHMDHLGRAHVRMDQHFQGVRIWGGEAIAHVNEKGEHLPMTDALRKDVGIGVSPSIQESEALASVHADLAPKGSYARTPEIELVVYPELVDVVRPAAREKKQGKLNAADMERQVKGYVLAYHVHTELENGADETSHMDYLVNAHMGTILKKWSTLETSGVAGTGNSEYSGTVSLNVNSVGGGYELRDTTRGASGNITTDLAHGTSGTGAIYADADNYWGDGQDYVRNVSTIGANGQTAGVDAHFGMQSTWNYYQNVHGRNGIDNAGRATYSRVHYDTNYNNAFWADSCFCMTYGDGDGVTLKVLTALDVAGHEMSHGVTSNSARLVYSGESGGLNEATSDIFGTMTEFYARGGVGSSIGNTGGNWTLGEQIVLTRPALRWIYKPSMDNIYGDYSLDAWQAGMAEQQSPLNDVHYLSGPMNRCFYFLSQGATVSGDTSSTYLPGGMTGIGNDKAARIWYQALTAYLTSTSNYADARSQAIRAVTDLYGAPSAESFAVKNAFAAINVGPPADSQPPAISSVNVSGSSGLITLSATVTDNVGVTRVDYWVDGANVISAISAPFSALFDSTRLATGSHTLIAKAYDAEGNEGVSSSVSFNIANNTFTEVEDNGSIGSANVVPDDATAIAGRVTLMSDQDYFRINVAAGHTLSVYMSGDNAMFLDNASGTILARAPHGEGYITYTNSSGSNQTYYLQVKGYWDSSLTINPDPNPRVPVYGPYTLSLVR